MTTFDQDIPMVPGDWTKRLAKQHRLYGREVAAASLMESFDRISRGQGEIVLVPGYSGVGKTALVQEIRRPVRDRNGFFLHGKFNQYQQNIPYFAVRQALVELARELQSEDEPLREQWKFTLQQAVGGLGRLLVDLVPEFAPLLGPQPAVAEISPLEARHRFARVLQNFFAAVCQPEHPVVLFIDDWQWADTASFDLLKQLQIGTTLRYLLVIAPYRDNEVDLAHPLVATLEELRRQTVPVSVIEIRNLEVEDVLVWVQDLLQPRVDNPEALAKFIHSRTKGNPFFTQASLAFLHDFGLLHFDRSCDCWHWAMETAGVDGLPEDVVELFRLRLLRLDQESRDLLTRAACLGNHFDLDSLAVISRRRPDECRALLLAIQEMVVPVGENDRSGHLPGDEAPLGFMFVHDRVQQAAYGLIPAEDLPSVRLEIGRLLLARLSRVQLAERLFEVTDHLNIGQLLIEDIAGQVQAVELNVAAARKARAATAYRAALQFHRAAGRFLADPAFAEHLRNCRHELALSLFQEWAESEFLEGDRTEAEHCVEQAVAHAGTPVEKAGALTILIVQNTLLARYPEAIAAGRLALTALGITLPEEGYEAACDTEIDLVRRSLAGRSVASLADLPVMSHPEMRMAAKILITMGPPCYRSHQRLWGVIVPKVVNLTLRYGNIEQVGYSHPAFAGLLCWVANDLALAEEFGELATRLMTHVFHSPSDRSVYALMIGSSVRHWFHPLKKGSEDYAEACEIGLQSGNLQYTAYAFGHNMYCRFYQGIALDDLIEESQRSLAFTRTRLNQWAIDLLEGGLHIFSSLSGSEADSGGPESWSETDYLGKVEAHRNIQVTCIYKILKTFSLLLLGRYDNALEMSDQAEAILYTVGMQGLLPWPEHRYARLLILTALAPDADEKRQTERRAELAKIIAHLRLWAAHCPENFEHQYQLAAAEQARLDHRQTDAIRSYEQAIAGAGYGGFVQWEGIANERAARFWQECGNGRLAQMYWQQAYACFARWGSKAKLQAMENEYRLWLAADLSQSPGTADVLTEQTRNALLEKQVQLLRSLTLQSTEAHMQEKLERQAEELALATEHLRAEVAERKRAEEALRSAKESAEEGLQKERALMAAIVESSEDAIIGKTLDGIITSWNRGAEKVFGYTAEEIVGQSVLALIPPERRNEEEMLLAAIGLGKSVKPYETERLCKNGHRIDISVTISPIRDREGRIVGASKIARDITERKKMEDALRESALYARSLIEASIDPLVTIGADGKIMDVNAATENVTGIARDALMGSDFSDYFTEPEKARAGYRQVFEQGSVNDYPLAIRHASGKLTEVLYNATLYRDAQGKVAGIFAAARDITVRKKMENALRESALYARSLIEASLDPLVTINADGKIMDVNAATENVTGVARDALIGSDFSDYFTEPEKARAGYRQVFEQGSVNDYPLAIRHASGNLIEVLYNATLYRDAQGKVAGVFAAARDITERKKMEDELKRSNAELDQFAYAVSHDMRQPLRMVTSYMSLIENTLAGQLDEDTRQYLSYASDGAKRMDQMILAMLDFSRVGRKTDPITSISSREVLNDTLSILNPDIIADAATVEVTGDWPELTASRDELTRLLQNLIANALKYHEPDQPPRVEIHAAATPTLFRVTIRDHGIGIDPNQTARLFKVFSRLQARTRFEGTGVGLALCRKIVEHHGGRIGVESAGEGQGSTFWFELPRTTADEKPLYDLISCS